MAFLISRCQPKLRWNLALNVCSLKCVNYNLKRIHKFIKRINFDIRKLHSSLRNKIFSSLTDKKLKILLKKFIFIFIFINICAFFFF